MRLMHIALAVLIFASPAVAEDQPSPQQTVEQCLTILAGLRGLNGYQQVVKENGTEKVVQRQYNLGGIRWTVGINTGTLEQIEANNNRVRNALVMEIGHGQPIDPKSPEWMTFSSRYQTEVLDLPCNLTLPKIKLGDLKLGDGPDQNQIPPAVLGWLKPIIDDK